MAKKIKEGIRDIYDVGDNKLVLVSTDRVSLYNCLTPNTVPNKGAISNLLSAFWFDYTKHIIPNHMISTNGMDIPVMELCPVERNQMLVKKVKMIQIECIVRGYLAGSAWENYQKDGTVCGIQLPDGLMESEKLPEPIYTPTTKSTEGQDEHITFEETVKLIGEELAKKLRDKSIEIYTKCSEYALKRGIIIADTKFEYGIDENGTLILADEIFTPDSSRFWSLNDYEIGTSQYSFDNHFLEDYVSDIDWDKQAPAPIIPDMITNILSKRYLELFTKITGMDF